MVGNLLVNAYQLMDQFFEAYKRDTVVNTTCQRELVIADFTILSSYLHAAEMELDLQANEIQFALKLQPLEIVISNYIWN